MVILVGHNIDQPLIYEQNLKIFKTFCGDPTHRGAATCHMGESIEGFFGIFERQGVRLACLMSIAGQYSRGTDPSFQETIQKPRGKQPVFAKNDG